MFDAAPVPAIVIPDRGEDVQDSPGRNDSRFVF